MGDPQRRQRRLHKAGRQLLATTSLPVHTTGLNRFARVLLCLVADQGSRAAA